MPRFVVLHHEMPPGDARPTHWDLMLESGGALRTWSMAEPPPVHGVIAVCSAEALPDHRLAYLEYEGEVSGARGRVTRWDAGTYEPLPNSADDGPAIRVVLSGQRFQGPVMLMPREGRYWSINWNGS